MSISRDDVDRWLAQYVAAWKSYDPNEIGALFSDDIEYRYHPYDDDPVRGRNNIVADWLGEGDDPDASQDEPGTYEGSYATIAVDGDLAIATGSSTYRNTPGGPVDRVYDNCFVMRFDAERRCREFTEWYMKRP